MLIGGGNHDDRHSIGAHIIKIGTGAVSWESKKQSCIALSSREAEHMVLCQAAKESMWTTDFLISLGVSVHNVIVINTDNQGSITLAKNPVFHDCLKHIDIQYQFTCDLLKEGNIGLNYVHYVLTMEMVADLLTKSLPHAQHEHLSKGMCIRPLWLFICKQKQP